jgi:hypothetical protein
MLAIQGTELIPATAKKLGLLYLIVSGASNPFVRSHTYTIIVIPQEVGSSSSISHLTHGCFHRLTRKILKVFTIFFI